ncbi:type II toxin-antitoxin system HicA family toxin [Facilibium subflavum]|uniref:type II toxin-antitoxin system HicA family toxin n=1 Tax=Facilibium subflavum TaxID=2219058 RepID=UPI000E65B785|nr:type II toxin-antitoxin system HicA family toxin [Facilibium subflavum]
MPVSGKDVLKKLLKNGWALKSVKGSHHKLTKNGITVIIPVHRNKDLGKGLLQKIEKDTKLKF